MSLEKSKNETVFQLFCPSEPGLVAIASLFEAAFFSLTMSLISVSFLSMICLRALKSLQIRVCSTGPGGWTGPPTALNLVYCKRILPKKNAKARKHATPLIRNRPQKLFSESWTASVGLSRPEHRSRGSHLSWIRWSSPFSDSWRIAVDKSTASGESRWNAW